MAKLLGKTIGMIINVFMIPIVLILAIPMGILKARRAQKSRLLFTGAEQNLLGKAQRIINMKGNGLFSPDSDLLEIANCIESARCDYQIIKSRERFDSTFSEFVIPRINTCNVVDWGKAKSFFGLPNHMQREETEEFIKKDPVGNILHSNASVEALEADGGMRLEEAEVDILAIARNNKVIYLNSEADHLFSIDQDGDEKLDGRVVNFVFSGQFEGEKIELFVAFDDSDSYTMFTLQSGMMERLNYVTQAIFKYFAESGVNNIFSMAERYSTQYIYTFKAYRKNGKYFLVNNAQTQAYLIDNICVMRDDVDEIKNTFWNERSSVDDFDDVPFDNLFAPTDKKELRLEDIVDKTSDTGYVFLDMNNDLAQCSFNWPQASPQLLMAYGYARRTIASSLLIQGVVDKDTYTHTASLFRDIQAKTIHTVEFQEQAARDAETFMATYDPRIDRVVTGAIVGLAKEFKPFSALVPLDDSRLFSALLHQNNPD